MGGDHLQLLIQGGAVGLCILLIIKDYQKDKLYNKTINNHLEHDELAKKEMAAANIELAQAITHLSDVIKGV